MPKLIYCKRKLFKNLDEKQVYFPEKSRPKAYDTGPRC